MEKEKIYDVQNITTNLATEIEFENSFELITLTNSSFPTVPVTIDLYLEAVDPSINYFILRTTQIPAGTSLELGISDIKYLDISRKLMIRSFNPTGDITVTLR